MKQTAQPDFPFDAQLHPGSIKTAMKFADAGSRDLWQVPPSNLRVIANFNVRIDNETHQAKIREYADSMKSEGYYQDKPLAGYVAKEGDEQIIYIYDGHTRLAAVNLANSEGAEIQKVPVVVSQAGVSMEDLTVALVRGNSGQPLSPYEIGLVCKRLVRYGLEIADISIRIGFTEPYVNSLLNLMASPVELRKMVITGVVSASTAIDMLNQYGDKALEKLLEAQERANAAGKARVTNKHLAPDHAFKKAIKKSAGTMFTAISEVKADPGYAQLSSTIRDKLDALLADLNKDSL